MKLPEEQARRRLVAQWLQKAETDLEAAESLLNREPPLLYPSCFFCQQAAEKCLKGLLTWHQRPKRPSGYGEKPPAATSHVDLSSFRPCAGERACPIEK